MYIHDLDTKISLDCNIFFNKPNEYPISVYQYDHMVNSVIVEFSLYFSSRKWVY